MIELVDYSEKYAKEISEIVLNNLYVLNSISGILKSKRVPEIF